MLSEPIPEENKLNLSFLTQKYPKDQDLKV